MNRLVILTIAIAFSLPQLAEANNVGFVSKARGSGSKRVVNKIRESIADKLVDSQYELKTIYGRKAKKLNRCLGRRCFKKQARRNRLKHVISVRVKKRSRRYIVSVSLFSKSGRKLAKKTIRLNRRLRGIHRASRVLFAKLGVRSSTKKTDALDTSDATMFKPVSIAKAEIQATDSEEPPL